MKRFLYILMVALMALTTLSCNKEKEKEYQYNIMTGGVKDITKTSAILCGGIEYYHLVGGNKVLFSDWDKFEFDEVGFYLSKTEEVDPSTSTRLISDGEGDYEFPYNFSVKATGLDPGTVYYYIAFLKVSSGEIIDNEGAGSFTTKELPVDDLTLDPDSATMEVGETLTITPSFTPSNASNKTLKWYSSQTRVATVENGVVTAHAPGDADISAWTQDGSDIVKRCQITVNPPRLVQTLVLDPVSARLAVNETLTITATVTPSDATYKELEWSSSRPDIAMVEKGVVKALAPGGAIISAKTLDGSNIETTCTVNVKAPYTANGVDLGLGVLWGDRNLGANTPEDFGEYFAWGETETKDKFTQFNYSLSPLKSNGAPYLIAYCPVNKSSEWNYEAKPDGPDGLTQLLPEHDAASVLLKGKWRMPTLDEMLTLLALHDDSEHYVWENWSKAVGADGKEVLDLNGNIIYGIRITQKSTGHSIFLPAAGSNGGDQAGSWGAYWTSSLYVNQPWYAWHLGLGPGGADKDCRLRYAGFSIRPVCDK
jgi:hypothetical protein